MWNTYRRSSSLIRAGWWSVGRDDHERLETHEWGRCDGEGVGRNGNTYRR